MNYIIRFKNDKEKIFELKEGISIEALKTTIENRANNCAGKVDGNINFGTITEDGENYSIGDIKEIKINF